MTGRRRVGHAIDALAGGEFVVLVDTVSDDKDGMLVLAADCAEPARIDAMSALATGWHYLALCDDRCRTLGLEAAGRRLSQTVSIRASDVPRAAGADEQARTIAVAIDPEQPPTAIREGGHVLPLRSSPGGVLERPAHAEAAIDMTRLAGLTPAALMSELVDDDGVALQPTALRQFARRNHLPLLTIEDLIAHRQHTELVAHVVETTLPTVDGTYRVHGYRCARDGSEHAAFVRGEIGGDGAVLVYVHPSCWQGDVFGGRSCDCRTRLDSATQAIASRGRGVIVHIARREPYFGCGRDGESSARDEVSARILEQLGVEAIHLLTDEEPPPAFAQDGLNVIAIEPLSNVARAAGVRGGGL